MLAQNARSQLLFLASTTYACAAAPSPASQPEYWGHAVPLSRDRSYLNRLPPSDFWALNPYYVGQRDDVSCSLATLTMLVNAARHGSEHQAPEPVATQGLLFDRVNSATWHRGLAANGDGVTLDQLGELTHQSYRAFGLAARVEVTHVARSSRQALATFRAKLQASEANSRRDFIVLNFLARTYVGSGDYGHFAPVAAYDARRRRVLVLDPDREYYEPYWIPDTVALAGMATPDSVTAEPRGYLHVTLAD